MEQCLYKVKILKGVVGMKTSEKSVKRMIEELRQYYEAAGIAEEFEKDIKGKTPDEIKALYKEALEEGLGEFLED